ncbi:MAG: glycosyltransferase family 4 protein [Treponema sp.]|uniref:glycosyltransferase family 4 protein n=1 Tax=Treponema sp. TaxID=166 RepID=UPI00298E23ED|nr:glycosyltransferase family 1 protein [Treponema sp.]MCQ2600287.1 glycosyltransferase family 4 protein [Treponema sp.]
MKIAIDYRLAASSNRGMARYCREIVKELFALDKKNQYFLLASTIPEDIKLPDNFSFYKLSYSNFILSEQFSLPKAVNKIKPDILWCPSNTFPIKKLKRTKLVVTIHDLIFFNKSKEKNSLYKQIGKSYRKFVLKFFSRNMDHYFTVSQYSNNEILSRLKLKCTGDVTVNCLSKEFLKKCNTVDVKKRESFYYTVSGDSPSKNLNFLISAFNNELENEKLYIAGLSKNSPMRDKASENIVFLPAGMSDEELITYYKKCKAFIFPSLEEGFGIPIIEALACNTKVLCSNASCLPEIIEEQGLLFDPNDTASLVNAIKNIKKHRFSYDVSKYESWKKTAKIVYNYFSKEADK